VVLRPPELPPVQKPAKPRPPKEPGKIGRALAAVGGVVFAITAVVGLVRALQDPSGQSSPFRSLAMVIPTVVFVRYALTGKLKLG